MMTSFKSLFDLGLLRSLITDLSQIRAQDPDHVQSVVQPVLAAQPADDVCKALVILKGIRRPVGHLGGPGPRYIMHLTLMTI